MASLGAAQIVLIVAQNSSFTGGNEGLLGFDAAWQRIQFWALDKLSAIGLGQQYDLPLFLLVWLTFLVLLLVLWTLQHTPWGRVLRAIREDEDAAAALGKNVFAYKLQSLAVGAALGGVAGLFYAWQFSFFSPDDFAPLLTFFAYTIVILGGTARLWAVPLGAVVFGVIFAGTRFFDFPPFTYFDSADRAYLRLAVIGAILIGLMALRPQGLFGKRDEMVLE
jgi:branched-chain amino acid transport system permease protein